MQQDQFEKVSSALHHLSNEGNGELAGHDWRIRVGMTIKAGLGDAGEDLWVTWADRDERQYRQHWKNLRPQRITVGSLFHWAKEAGWKPDRREYTASERAEWRHKKQEGERQRDLRQAEDKLRESQAAYEATQVIAQSVKRKHHPYMERKGLGHIPCMTEGEDIVVPLRQSDNETVVAYQRIKADGSKRFLPKGNRWSGAAFEFGAGDLVLHCEGLATGLSAWLALKRKGVPCRVRVAFNDSNMNRTSRDPDRGRGVGFVIADNDASGAGERAAVRCGLPYWMPPEVDTDANDYHVRFGLDALGDALLSALERELS